MARKKTKVETATNQAVAYQGKVTIKYIKSGKQRTLKVHNEGKISLFTFLTKCIANELSGIDNYLPYYIMCYHKNDLSSEDKTAMIKSSIFISTSPVREDDNGRATTDDSKQVQLQFFIPSGSFVGTSTINYLELTNNYGNVCASLNLSDSEAIDISIPSNILISWVLSFENKTN